jgi:hypothetical protein
LAAAVSPTCLGSVVLPNVPIRPVEQLLILMQLVLEQRLSESHLDLALAGVSVLPSVESDVADDLVDVVHNALDHDRRLLVLRLLEQLGQCSFAQRLVSDRLGGLLRRDHVPSQVEQCLQEVDAQEQSLFVLLLERLEPLAQSLERMGSGEMASHRRLR